MRTHVVALRPVQAEKETGASAIDYKRPWTRWLGSKRILSAHIHTCAHRSRSRIRSSSKFKFNVAAAARGLSVTHREPSGLRFSHYIRRTSCSKPGPPFGGPAHHSSCASQESRHLVPAPPCGPIDSLGYYPNISSPTAPI